MDTTKKVNYYVLTTIDSEKYKKMKYRFEHENIEACYCPVVEFSDARLSEVEDKHKRPWSCMLGHLDMFARFLKSDAKYGVFCEDDVHIRRGITEIIPETIAKYERRNLEILMLGYLFPFKPVELTFYHEPEFYHQKLDIIDENLIYFSYIERLWGSQMYMLDRKTAERFLNTYTIEYAKQSLMNPDMAPYAVDWTITKNGRRAAVYPMLAVEEKPIDSSDYGQYTYHTKCNEVHYDASKYI
jgi:GR25 family glycosyltransferase involved in LPS biosynthesis